MPMITMDAAITVRSIVSHVGMRLSVCCGMACPFAPHSVCRKSVGAVMALTSLELCGSAHPIVISFVPLW
jgi:hypothetical protein